jgi:hypothetical protein
VELEVTMKSRTTWAVVVSVLALAIRADANVIYQPVLLTFAQTYDAAGSSNIDAARLSSAIVLQDVDSVSPTGIYVSAEDALPANASSDNAIWLRLEVDLPSQGQGSNPDFWTVVNVYVDDGYGWALAYTSDQLPSTGAHVRTMQLDGLAPAGWRIRYEAILHGVQGLSPVVAALTFYYDIDADHDGAGITGYTIAGNLGVPDCNDHEATIHPGAVDVPGNGIDEDCDGVDASLPVAIGWCNLQWPPSLAVSSGAASELVYGQVWIDGVTSQPGATPGLTAELGWGPDGSDPGAVPGAWQWTPASFNLDVGNNDEFMACLTVPVAGTYDYAYRYSFNSGPWVYGDLDGSANGYSPTQAGSVVVTSGTDAPVTQVRQLRLYPNQPNPFHSPTVLRFDLPVAGRVRLEVYDVRGRLVRSLVDDALPAGSYRVVWDGRDPVGRVMASGAYFARLSAGGRVETERMGLVR